jgi:hypothetical protein
MILRLSCSNFHRRFGDFSGCQVAASSQPETTGNQIVKRLMRALFFWLDSAQRASAVSHGLRDLEDWNRSLPTISPFCNVFDTRIAPWSELGIRIGGSYKDICLFIKLRVSPLLTALIRRGAGTFARVVQFFRITSVKSTKPGSIQGGLVLPE